MNDTTISSLEELIDRLCRLSSEKQDVFVADMVNAAGRRSFGALLLVPGLIVLSPLSGIPGLPTAFAIAVALIAVQMIIGRQCFWLPSWVMRRKASSPRLQQALRAMRPVARFADRMTKPRVKFLSHGFANYLIAGCCLLIAATMPPLELIPFANSAAGAALTLFGLSLVAEDGLLAAIATVLFVSGTVLLGVKLL